MAVLNTWRNTESTSEYVTGVWSRRICMYERASRYVTVARTGARGGGGAGLFSRVPRGRPDAVSKVRENMLLHKKRGQWRGCMQRGLIDGSLGFDGGERQAALAGFSLQYFFGNVRVPFRELLG